MRKIFYVVLLFFLMQLNVVASGENTILPSVIGKIQNIEYMDLENSDITTMKQVVSVKLLSGKLKGESIVVENQITGNPYYDIPLKKNLKVLLHTEQNGENLKFSIEDIYGAPFLGWLLVIFSGLLIYIGKKKGFYSLIAIIITAILIFKCLAPLILIGINPVFGTILLSLLSTAITIYFVGGFNRKSTSAIFGCIGSLVIAGVLSIITVKVTSLTGFINENTTFLYASHPELNYTGLIVSVMMLAALGAVMDVGMSIASTINEIYLTDNTKTFKELFISGMNVGRDIIGTMANTLILVYLGSSLPLILLVSEIDLLKFINLNQVVAEISSAIIGSCAIVICVPVTAFFAAKLIKNSCIENLEISIQSDTD